MGANPSLSPGPDVAPPRLMRCRLRRAHTSGHAADRTGMHDAIARFLAMCGLLALIALLGALARPSRRPACAPSTASGASARQPISPATGPRARPAPTPAVKLAASQIARLFPSEPEQMAPWEPMRLTRSIHADVLLMYEADDAIVPPAHSLRFQAARPSRQTFAWRPAARQTRRRPLCTGRSPGAGRARYASAIGAFADRVLAARAAERSAARAALRSAALSPRLGCRSSRAHFAASPARMPRRCAPARATGSARRSSCAERSTLRGSGPPCADRAAAGARSRQPPSGVRGSAC